MIYTGGGGGYSDDTYSNCFRRIRIYDVNVRILCLINRILKLILCLIHMKIKLTIL